MQVCRILLYVLLVLVLLLFFLHFLRKKSSVLFALSSSDCKKQFVQGPAELNVSKSKFGHYKYINIPLETKMFKPAAATEWEFVVLSDSEEWSLVQSNRSQSLCRIKG